MPLICSSHRIADSVYSFSKCTDPHCLPFITSQCTFLAAIQQQVEGRPLVRTAHVC